MHCLMKLIEVVSKCLDTNGMFQSGEEIEQGGSLSLHVGKKYHRSVYVPLGKKDTLPREGVNPP